MPALTTASAPQCSPTQSIPAKRRAATRTVGSGRPVSSSPLSSNSVTGGLAPSSITCSWVMAARKLVSTTADTPPVMGFW